MKNKFYKAIMLELDTADKILKKKPKGITMSQFIEELLKSKSIIK